MHCRFCNSITKDLFLSLGASPLSNAYLREDQLSQMEPFYPLEAYVCRKCFLVQIEEYQSPDQLFHDYAYFSSFSDTWLNHAKVYVDTMIDRFDINRESFVIEVASNDGYLLQYFVKNKIPSLGIEPAANIADMAQKNGIPTANLFLGRRTALEIVKNYKHADLLIANNVLAHVPDINDFVGGLKILLNPRGFITLEFPHLFNLVEDVQFDTIYHEHFSYFSFVTVDKIFSAHRLSVFDVEQLPTHGGSLRIFVKHQEDKTRKTSSRVKGLKKLEISKGYQDLPLYQNFSEKVRSTKREILKLLISLKQNGKSIVAYGAPAKGNTLLNYCGIRTDFIDYTVDRNPQKQNHYLPGSHIPINAPDKIRETKPDYVFILPWNLKEEILDQLAYIRQWGGKFITPIPEVLVL
jgi:hypothetical protein